MRSAIFLSLIIAAGCILATGCVTETKKSNVSGNVSLSPTDTFTPFVNTSKDLNPHDMGLKGMLTISIGGWKGEFPVSVDTMSVGVVSTDRPKTLMIEEGNHTVEICCGMRCEEENVYIRFGKQRTVDFSEQLKRDLEFIEPTARITGYRPNSDQISIDVEFINPTSQALTLSADVSCGYSYIESRSYNRINNIAQGHLSATVDACDRITQTLKFNLASGYNYVYDDIPTITNISSE
ncbi:MAG: hypothetical protein ABSE07_09820 [Methanoregula sp.]|jgi:hypothetical protein